MSCVFVHSLSQIAIGSLIAVLFAKGLHLLLVIFSRTLAKSAEWVERRVEELVKGEVCRVQAFRLSRAISMEASRQRDMVKMR